MELFPLDSFLFLFFTMFYSRCFYHVKQLHTTKHYQIYYIMATIKMQQPRQSHRQILPPPRPPPRPPKNRNASHATPPKRILHPKLSQQTHSIPPPRSQSLAQRSETSQFRSGRESHPKSLRQGPGLYPGGGIDSHYHGVGGGDQHERLSFARRGLR